jgi:uncharacterized protein YodC (DUF2158 family)
MSDEAIKQGDIVQLKSGSPNMTVTFIVTDEHGTDVHVAWFDEKHQPHSGHYPLAALDRW